MKVTRLLILFLVMTGLAQAGEKMSDAEIKRKLIGYWKGPRYVFPYKSDGFCYPIGRMGERARWEIKNGTYYENGMPCDIIMLTDKKFVYRFRGGETVSRTKMSEKEGETFRKQTDFSN